MSALNFDARINGDQLQRDIDGVNSKIKGMTSGISKEGQNIDSIFKKIGIGIGAYFGVQQVASFVKEIAKIRGEFQDLATSFETILKSKEKADKLMAQVVQFAATTPFNLKDVASGTKQLLAYGFTAESMIGNLRMLGDVAAGTSTPISDLIYLYGTLQTQGRAYTKDIMQFTGRGIPIIEELGKVLGVAKGEVQGMVEAGRVGFPEVEKAFQSMAGASGIFGGLMEKQSKNINGMYSNLIDEIDQAMNSIGESNQNAIGGAIKTTTLLVQNYEKIGGVILTLISTYGAYKAAVVAAAAAQGISSLVTNIQLISMFRKELGLVTAAQQAFNLSAKANPYGLILAGITAVVGAFMIFTDKTKEAKDYISDLNNAMEQIGRQIEIDALIAKFDELNKIEVKTTEQQTELNKTIQELAIIFPDAISGYDQYGKAIDIVSEKLVKHNEEFKKYLRSTTGEDIKNSQKELDKLIEKRSQLITDISTGIGYQKSQVSVGGGIATGGESFLFTEGELKGKKAQIDELNTSIDGLYKSIKSGKVDLLKLDSADIAKFKAEHIGMFDDISKYTKQQALDTSAKLMSLYGTGNAKADEAILKQVTALKEYANGITTVGERAAAAQKSLDTAKAKLAEMTKPNSESTAKQIEEQETLIASLEKTLGVKKKAAKEEDKIKATQDAMQKAAEAGNTAELQRLAKVLTELEKKKKKLEDIIALEMYRAKFSKEQLAIMDSQAGINAPMSGINSREVNQDYVDKLKTATDVKGKKVMFEITAIDKTGATWKKVKLQGDRLKKQVDDGAKDSADKQKELDQEIADKKKKDAEDLLNFSRQFTSELISQLGLTEEQSKQLNGVADTIFNLAKGDYMAAAFSAASMVMTMMIKSFSNQKVLLSDYYKEVEAHIKKVTDAVNLINEALSNVGSGMSVSGLNIMQTELIRLKNDAELLNSQLAIINSNTEGRRGGYGTTTTNEDIRPYIERARITVDLIDRTAMLREQIELLSKKLLDPNLTNDQREAIISILNGYNEIVSTINSSIQDITGITYDSLSNAFSDAFLSGEDAAVKWGEKVNEIIKNVIGKQLTAKLLADPITNAVNTLVKDQSDGLSPEEAKKFKDTINGIYTTVAPAYEAAMEAMKLVGIDLTNSSSLSGTSSPLTGAVKGIEEQTAGLIAGQLMAIRDYQVRGFTQLESINTQCSHLSAISMNTKEANRLLKDEIKTELVAMNKILSEKL